MEPRRPAVAERGRTAWLGNILFLASTTLVGVVLGEPVLRLSGQPADQPYRSGSAPHMRADEHLGWANLKRFSGRVEEAANTIFGDISSIGARRPERVGQKLHKEHRYRIPRNSCAHV